MKKLIAITLLIPALAQAYCPPSLIPGQQEQCARASHLQQMKRQQLEQQRYQSQVYEQQVRQRRRQVQQLQMQGDTWGAQRLKNERIPVPPGYTKFPWATWAGQSQWDSAQ